jgi:hypothetical protein
MQGTLRRGAIDRRLCRRCPMLGNPIRLASAILLAAFVTMPGAAIAGSCPKDQVLTSSDVIPREYRDVDAK